MSFQASEIVAIKHLMKSGKGLIDKEKHGFRISVPIGLSDRLVALVFVILTVFYYLNQFIDH